MKSIEHDTAVGTVKKSRRKFSTEFKRDLVAQTLAPGASVSGIALANGLNTNLLFAWRRQQLPVATATSQAVLLPIHLEAADDSASRTLAAPVATVFVPATASHIEIAFNRATVRLHGDVHCETLRLVLQCLAS